MKSQKVTQYLTNIESGFIKSRAVLILKHIAESRGITLWELRKTTSISHQTLTSAISNLMNLGIVKIIGKTEIDNKNYSNFEFVKDANEIKENAEKRKNEKLLSWIKVGLGFDLPYSLQKSILSYKDLIEANNKNDQLALFSNTRIRKNRRNEFIEEFRNRKR